MLERIDSDRRLYVIREGKGFTCLGFEIAEEWRRKYLEFMGEADPAPNADPLVGTPEHFAAYERVLSRAAEYSRAHDKRCESFLHPQLIGLEGKRVEVVEDYGDANPRRFYVGKSTGWAPIHLEISRRNSHGGGAVSSRCYRSVRVVGQR